MQGRRSQSRFPCGLANREFPFPGIRLTLPHRGRIGLQVFENTPNKDVLSTHIYLAS